MPSPADSQRDDFADRVAGWLADAQSVVAFTGAGVGTERVVADFRWTGGSWSQTQPVYFDDFLASADARKEYWRQKSLAHRDFALAQPNVGHRVLAAWEAAARLRGVITQNIDGLHQLAGNRHVLELHGTARAIGCLDCGARYEPESLIEQFQRTGEVPPCPACAGRLKTATISFGQALPEDVLTQSIHWVESCDLLLVMGSSLVVEPAASIPRIAAHGDARVVIINREPTPQDHTADAVIHDSIGAALSAVEPALARIYCLHLLVGIVPAAEHYVLPRQFVVFLDQPVAVRRPFLEHLLLAHLVQQFDRHVRIFQAELHQHDTA